MLNYTQNCDNIGRKQLYNSLETCMSHRRHLYHPSVYLFCICYLALVRNPKVPLLGKVNTVAEFWNNMKNLRVAILFLSKIRLSYQNICLSVAKSPYSLFHPLRSASGKITCEGILCHLGANILECHPRNHLIYVSSCHYNDLTFLVIMPNFQIIMLTCQKIFSIGTDFPPFCWQT